jgi:superoxide reductase
MNKNVNHRYISLANSKNMSKFALVLNYSNLDNNLITLDMATKFYKCPHCGNIIQKVVDKKVPVVCCGQRMEELVPGTVEASIEKHLPVVTWLDEKTMKVEVGSIAHPMLEEHHISFIYVETESGGIRVDLKEKPEATISLGDEKAVAVYEYCNLHGLWKTEL